MNKDLDMRQMARNIGATINFPAGSVVFNTGDAGNCMYIVQSGMIEMVIGDKIIETVGPNEAIGFMSMVDSAPRSSTARVKEACELSVIDGRTSASWSTKFRTSRSTSWARWPAAFAAWVR